jgi:hypothetical protein
VYITHRVNTQNPPGRINANDLRDDERRTLVSITTTQYGRQPVDVLIFNHIPKLGIHLLAPY